MFGIKSTTNKCPRKLKNDCTMFLVMLCLVRGGGWGETTAMLAWLPSRLVVNFLTANSFNKAIVFTLLE